MTATDHKRALLIAGPTASGKSALALEKAAGLNGVIINADALQVYSALRILSARPTPDEEARAPHRLRNGHLALGTRLLLGEVQGKRGRDRRAPPAAACRGAAAVPAA